MRPEGTGATALPVIALNDEKSKGEEAQIAYELFAGNGQTPKAWVRKGGSSGTNNVYGEGALPEKAWSHIALTDDGSVIRLYVNGVLGKEENSTNVAPLLTAAEGPLSIGCGIEYGTYKRFKGRIDEVRVYNRALSAAEVPADAAAPTLINMEASFEIEGKGGENTLAVARAQELPKGETLRINLAIETLGPPEDSVDSRPRPRPRSKVKVRAYDFTTCGFTVNGMGLGHGSEIPAPPHLVDFKQPMRELVEAQASTADQKCDPVEGTIGAHEELAWLIRNYGLFKYQQGEEVWVEEPPVCEAKGPLKPEKIHCKTNGDSSTKHLDILSDWKYKEGTFAPSFLPFQEICARLDGVLPINPRKQFTGERIIREKFHFHWWGAHTHSGEVCNYEHPGTPTSGY